MSFLHFSALPLAVLLLMPALPGLAQPSDACSPGWHMLNQLREQLTPETSTGMLALLHSKAESRLRVCRDIPDLWYYRYLIAQRLNNSADAAYALKIAREMDSAALRDAFNPLTKPPASALPPPAPLPKTVRDKWALVVGVGKFQETSHISSLSYTVGDATAFTALLASPA